jgi:ComF family protein
MHSAVTALKEKAARDVIYSFAYEMAQTVRREYGDIAFDAVTYVPLTKRDRRRRGHDQSQLLAKELARQLNTPCVTALVKLTQNRPQKELKPHERVGNVMGVYDVCADVQDQFVLLVDDVITTGATLNECAKMLRLYGARQVFVVTATASEPPQEKEKG